mgnify:CR=1 FL=1
MTANDKTGVGNGRDDWRTPPELFAPLNRMFRFDYDAFASHENALSGIYSTVAGTFSGHRINGLPLADSRETGLVYRPELVEGRRRFGNPPYSRGFLAQATEWFAKSRDDFDISVMLLPDARDTAWWRTWVKPYAIDWPIGRIRFLRPDGTRGDAPHGGSVVALYLPDWLNGNPMRSFLAGEIDDEA